MLRATSGADLQAYARAVEGWVDLLPAEALEEGGFDVPMPTPPPSQFVVEPFVTTEPVTVRA